MTLLTVPQMIVFAIALGLAAALLVPSLFVMRGRRFWGNWLMLFGSGGTIVAILGLGALVVWSNALYQSMMGGPIFLEPPLDWADFSQQQRELEILAHACLIAIGILLLVGATGFLATAGQWIKVRQRCLTLELETERLAAERGIELGASSGS